MAKNIILIGMPGCGKTTIGKLIAKELHREFCDIDDYIEKTQGKKIEELFLYGEDYFRKIESLAVEEVSKKNSIVISTGGGVIKLPQNISILKKNGYMIFIDRPIEKIIEDIDITKRPLLKDNKDSIMKLYQERYDLYKKYADYIIKNDTSLDEVVKKIVSLAKEVER